MHRSHQYIDVCFKFCLNNPAKMERNLTSSFEDVENKLYRHRKQQQSDTVKYFGRAFFCCGANAFGMDLKFDNREII